MNKLLYLILLTKVLLILGNSEKKEDVQISPALSKFTATLEQYTVTPNEVIFLLDESGSIGSKVYEEVKLFTELTVRHFAVSADQSRIAIIAFSDYPRTHVNYIKDSYGNNMCTLVRQIHAMDYLGMGTATRLAMEEARELFKQARPYSNKIIVLITDGQSNYGYSPVNEAVRLKGEDVIIFAVGVADINMEEVRAVASSENHIYILEDFSYIKSVNNFLKKAIREVSWDYVEDTSLCNNFCTNHSNCCDEKAKCYCGTIGGAYECNCGAGYYGTGHRHDCHPCPRGTYKSKVGNSNCMLCPEHSTTLQAGSSSESDCICDSGYVWNGNYCKIIECAKLDAPLGGILIPQKCGNAFGTECKVKCNEGFCPYSCNFPSDDFQVLPWNRLPLQSRTCLETGKWSGNDFLCEKMRCAALENPFYGKHNCSGSDFSFGTKCAFQCDLGYELSGSEIRECQLNGSWSGNKANCSVKYCEPLKPNQNLLVKNKKCSESKMPYRSVCIYYCKKGYTLTSQFGKNDGINECLANKTWSGANNKITCEDVSPPSIQCPKSITKYAEPSKSTAQVTWDMPKATDNVFVNSIQIKQPKFIRKPPYSFPIGTVKIVYEAVDSVQLSSTCSFNVTILDKEPPVVLFCPSDIEVFSETNDPIIVKWKEPEFKDNSGKYILTPPNKKSGDLLSWGPPQIIYYNVTDAAKNKASCNFTVTVKPYPCPYFKPPENGIVTCDTWQFGRLCSVFCNEGYDFASKKKIPTVFECRQTGSSVNKVGTWVPFELLGYVGFQMPVPDCSRKQKRSAIDISLNLNYTVDDCSDEVIKKMKHEFLNTLEPFEQMLPGFICRSTHGAHSCTPENVNVICVPRKSIQKRSIRRSIADKNILMVSFNFRLNETEDADQFVEETANILADELESATSKTLKEIYNISDVPEPQKNYNFVAICSVGQLRVNNSCINCPAGTHKDDFLDICADCPSSTYQDEENSLSCKACPVGYTTYQTRSKSFTECKAPCKPGSYSKTSFEPCFPCPLHTFQNQPRSQECKKCPKGLKTWRTASNSSSDCSTACQPGSYSDTGMEPCILCDFGFYQDKGEQKSCELCPNSSSTREKGSQSLDKCEEINACEELKPCSNGSTCIPQGNSYICICHQGIFGEHCEKSSNFCEDDFCLNNGTCVKVMNDYECTCIEGFTGKRCEVNIDDCQKGLCRNGGKCIDLINGYECICQPGYSGSNCEINIFECASNPCLNGGTCFDKLNGYKCCCAPGYTGLNCDNKVDIQLDPCENVQCQNDGICISNNASAECSCKTGFVGELCEVNVDDCTNYTCYNDGICIDGIQNATCQCRKMFSGSQCEKEFHPYLLSFPNPTTANYAKIENKKRLTAITVTLFMRTNYKEDRSRPTPVSYSYYDEIKKVVIDNALVLFDTNRMIIYMHNEILHTQYSANKDSSWHHYAITWEKNDGKWAFYVDGEIVVKGAHIGEKEYMWPGVFVLGQEQDTLGATFNTLETFVGDIAEFNVWDYALSEQEIKLISKSCGFSGNLITWFQVSNHLHGSLIVSEDVDICKGLGICSEGSCHCLYSIKSDEYCKHEVQECNYNSCQNEQPCVKEDLFSYCNCSIGYSGRVCEYDENECIDNNGGCSHSCINTVGSYYCECPEHMVLSENKLKCIDTAFCEEDGQVFLDGQTWISSCRECLCNKSVVICQDLQCESINCLPEEHLIHFPGDCCPKCVLYSFCFLSPNNTVTAFDFSQYEFTEDCSYTVVEDCVHGQFSVHMEFSEDIHNSSKSLSVFQGCSHFQIIKVDQLFINNEVILPPFKNEEFDVKSTNASTDIWTNSGLYIQWHSNGEILLAVPSQTADFTCGICSAFQEHNVMKSERYKEIGMTSEKKCFGKIEDNLVRPNKAASIFIGYSLLISMLMLYLMCFIS